MVEVAAIRIRASYLERLEHVQTLHAFHRGKERVVGACAVARCTAFISPLFCLHRAILGSAADSEGVVAFLQKNGLFEPTQAMLSTLRQGGREGEKQMGVRGETGVSPTLTDKKRHAPCSASACIREQQTG